MDACSNVWPVLSQLYRFGEAFCHILNIRLKLQIYIGKAYLYSIYGVDLLDIGLLARPCFIEWYLTFQPGRYYEWHVASWLYRDTELKERSVWFKVALRALIYVGYWPLTGVPGGWCNRPKLGWYWCLTVVVTGRYYPSCKATSAANITKPTAKSSPWHQFRPTRFPHCIIRKLY